jgi:hypothetical protein
MELAETFFMLGTGFAAICVGVAILVEVIKH